MRLLPNSIGCLVPMTIVGIVVGGLLMSANGNGLGLLWVLFGAVGGAVVGGVMDLESEE